MIHYNNKITKDKTLCDLPYMQNLKTTKNQTHRNKRVEWYLQELGSEENGEMLIKGYEPSDIR